MADHELMFRPALELARMVHSGEIAACELVECSLERIEQLNPALNAFVQVDGERALRAAEEISPGDERPFAGVPIAIKNNRAVSGLRATHGAALLSQYVPNYDHNVTRRLKGAGFIVVGTTTLPEHGILPTTEPQLFGATRNPWDPTRSSGGSSGGSAVAVAAGMVPVAHGNDGGGSIRIPAACCGLVGLKPQRGRVSVAPDQGDSFFGCDGVLTRTVADTAAILDVLAGYEWGDATWAPPPPEPFATTTSGAAARDPGRLRIAATTVPPLADARVDPLCAEAVDEAAALLRELGHEVEEVQVPWQVKGLRELFGTAFSIHIGLSVAFSGTIAGREPRAEDMEALSWAIYSRVRQIDAITGLAMTTRLQAIARRVIEFLAPYDALLTPALAERPLPLGTLDPMGPDPLGTFTRSGYFTPFTPILNSTGQPAIALPLLHGSDGLPLAVQLVARPAEEGPLLALAAQLETARPWRDRRPAPAETAASR